MHRLGWRGLLIVHKWHISGAEKGTPKNFCDKDFAELSGEFSGAICLKPLVLLGSALELFRKFFGTVHAIFWVWGSFLVPEHSGLLDAMFFWMSLLQLLSLTRSPSGHDQKLEPGQPVPAALPVVEVPQKQCAI